jgi:hypothetical protein
MSSVVPITAATARITTAEVSIRAVQVGRKQVTLSVFRQVPYADILGADGELLGEPWGWVNYWWDGCGVWGRSPRLHVLWQRGGELRRACVPAAGARDPGIPPDAPPKPIQRKLTALLAEARSVAIRILRRRIAAEPRRFSWRYGAAPILALLDFGSLGEVMASVEPKEELAQSLHALHRDRALDALARGRHGGDREAAEAEVLAAIAASLADDPDDPSPEEDLEAQEDLLSDEADLITDAWTASRAECEAAGQLFIAV